MLLTCYLDSYLLKQLSYICSKMLSMSGYNISHRVIFLSCSCSETACGNKNLCILQGVVWLENKVPDGGEVEFLLSF